MGEHPKRRKDKYNPYTIYEKEGRFYISFKDGQGQRNSFEIEKELYAAFNEFELEDLSYLNVWDRHIEQSEVWESTLNERAVEVPESVEETVFRNIQNEKVHNAIEQLPEVQKRRVKMYFFEGMTFEEIAVKENCKHPAVVKSVKAALKKLKGILLE
ncbi:MAG: sigma-70 family RNA polymerase sigma factor [Lachnospiraceae bacterium]|nr:sigma-70 family RNA polymerase sigma factor [Lachnospiraceae bacterium]